MMIICAPLKKHPPPSPPFSLERRGKITFYTLVTYRITYKISRIKLQIITKKNKICLIITKKEIFIGKYKL